MTAVLDPPDDPAAERLLDELIPPPRSPIQKLLVGTLVLGSAILLAIGLIDGRLWPSPFASGSVSGSRLLVIDKEQGLVGATAIIGNFSGRDVRLVEVELIDAPGAEVASVEVLPKPDCEEEEVVVDSGDNTGGSVTVAATCSSFAIAGPVGAGDPLPVMIPSKDNVEVRFWFRPTACEHGEGPWGTVEATFDFGDGAFPPFAATALAEDRLWEGRMHMVGAILTTEEPVANDRTAPPTAGPLEVACKELDLK